MAFKKSFLERFFGSKQEKNVKESMEHTTQEKSEKLTDVKEEPAVFLELPRDHALNRLYELRISESKELSAPRLCMEKEQGMSPEEIEKELKAFQAEMTTAANLRLKHAMPKEEKESEEEKKSKEENKSEEEKEQKEDFWMDALPLIYVPKDRMSAWMMVFPPVAEGRELDGEILKKALEEKKVTSGIDEKKLEELPGHPEQYFCLWRVAKGTPAVQGTDGQIEDFFSRSVERKFAVDEHDRMDYTSLNLFQTIEKGAAICRRIPPTSGVPGKDVQGRILPARDGREVTLPKGKNTEISEDGTRLLALKTGDVEFRDRAFHVKSLLEIAGNVDYSTGNIDYKGEVHIHGNVSSGFSVRAEGNIVVDGVVASGNVEAGGDLIVAKGIVGGGDAMIRTDHDLYTKYLENSTVHVQGNVYADSIVNSEVYCDGNVQATSGRGVLVGGKVRASHKVSAKTIGSKAESATMIFLGGRPCVEFEIESLEENTQLLVKQLEKLECRPDSPSKVQRMEEFQRDLLEKQAKLEQLKEQMAAIEESEDPVKCKVECDTAYPGMLLSIGEVNFRLKQETWKCVAKLVDGEIRLV